MALFETSEQLQAVLQSLFDTIGQDKDAVQAVVKARLIIRLNITEPATAVIINGRKTPPELSYGATTLRPDLDIKMTAETLHRVLLKELRLRDAITGGLMKPHGPVWKSFVMEDIFHAAQELYPQVLQEYGISQ